MPRSGDLEDSLWSERNFEPFDAALCEPTALAAGGTQREPTALTAGGTQTLASASPHLQIPIEDVLLGARVPTKNPRRWDYDFEFEEPDEATWQCARLDIRLDDGERVEVELLRPTAWLRENGFFSCEQVPIRIEELDIQGVGVIRSIDPCPPLATGEGSVVTARFITHGVQGIVALTLVDEQGSVETIEGTTGHPVWSVDRRQWIPLDELQRGERVSTQAGPATVLSVTTTPRQTVVYNLEIHGEHVYQVGALGLLVHNSCIVGDEARQLVAESLDDALLGVVDKAGHVSFFRGGPPGSGLPSGHIDLVDWGIVEKGTRGFSVVVRDGKVTHFLRNSILNSGDFNLPKAMVDEILEQIPKIVDVVITGS